MEEIRSRAYATKEHRCQDHHSGSIIILATGIGNIMIVQKDLTGDTYRGLGRKGMALCRYLVAASLEPILAEDIPGLSKLLDESKDSAEPNKKIADLEKFTDIAVGRELKMARMEKELRALSENREP